MTWDDAGGGTRKTGTRARYLGEEVCRRRSPSKTSGVDLRNKRNESVSSPVYPKTRGHTSVSLTEQEAVEVIKDSGVDDYRLRGSGSVRGRGT